MSGIEHSRKAGEELVVYYRRRAAEYEAIYAKPERQADLARLRADIPGLLQGEDVLEVACGTGYWTAQIAPRARSVLATDVAGETLSVARSKFLPAGRVRLIEADAYRLDPSLGHFTAAFAGFWWSHIPRGRIAEFLHNLHARLEPGARVVLLDNRYVEGSSTPLAETDADGNTYQQRRLADGSVHRVLKNFPSPEQLRRDIGMAGLRIAEPPRVDELPHYWLCEYRLPAARA